MKEFEEYMKLLKMDKTNATIVKYNHDIKVFLGFFEIKTVSDVEKLTLSDYKKLQMSLSERLSAVSVNGMFAVLKAFHKFLLENDYIQSTKISLVKNLKVGKKAVRVINDNEFDGLLSCATKDEKIMLLVMRYTGLRRTEMSRVKVSDIFDGKVLIHGKGNKDVLIPLHKELLSKIENYLQKRKHDSEYLLVGKATHEGITAQAIYTRVKSIGKKAFKKGLISKETLEFLSPHTIRKTFVTAIARTHGNQAAQEAARHATFSTTKDCYIANNPVLNANIFLHQERI
ncbi:MAG: tyrosine-type recombinase/integrase [Deltaproteobacteria bacterium]|nr:tyrosine-type recombinase/integrase [Deltaproteobacteria bacterium]